jgi:hypothetical protein
VSKQEFLRSEAVGNGQYFMTFATPERRITEAELVYGIKDCNG